MTKKIFFVCICLFMFTTACAQEDVKKVEAPQKKAAVSYSINEEIWNISNETIQVLKNKDMKKLADLVHPQKGVRISPDAYIEEGIDQVFKKDHILNFFEDKNIYLWGYYDGSGEPIKLTKKEYYEKWIYDKDFINADQIGINVNIGKGNTIQNHESIFLNGKWVEYHFKGFDKQFEGLDWESLRLVFEKYEDNWYLVAIIHDHWTI